RGRRARVAGVGGRGLRPGQARVARLGNRLLVDVDVAAVAAVDRSGGDGVATGDLGQRHAVAATADAAAGESVAGAAGTNRRTEAAIAAVAADTGGPDGVVGRARVARMAVGPGQGARVGDAGRIAGRMGVAGV